MDTEYRNGLLNVLTGCVLWGVGYPVWKLLALRIPAIPLIAITFALASASMFLLFRLKPKVLLREFRENWVMLSLLGLFGGVLGTGLILFALTRIDTGIAALLEKLQPVFVILVARVFLHEIIPSEKIKWMLLAIAFSYPVAVGNLSEVAFNNSDTLGILAAIGASIFYGSNTVISKHLVDKGIRPKELIFFRMGLSSVIATPICFLWPSAGSFNFALDGETVILLILGVGISLTSAYVFFFDGLKHISAGTASFLELLTPLVALIMSFVIFAETISSSQLLAIPLFVYFVYRLSLPVRAIEQRNC